MDNFRFLPYNSTVPGMISNILLLIIVYPVGKSKYQYPCSTIS